MEAGTGEELREKGRRKGSMEDDARKQAEMRQGAQTAWSLVQGGSVAKSF